MREFTTQAVDEMTLRRLIDAAIQAPSAVNEQPWSFVVVRDKGLLKMQQPLGRGCSGHEYRM